MSEKANALFGTISEAYSWLTEGSTNGAKTLSKILLALSIIMGVVTWSIAERYFILLDDVKTMVKMNNDSRMENDKLRFEKDQLTIKAEGLSQTISELVSEHPHEEFEQKTKPVAVTTYEVEKKVTGSVTSAEEMRRRRRLIEIINH